MVPAKYPRTTISGRSGALILERMSLKKRLFEEQATVGCPDGDFSLGDR